MEKKLLIRRLVAIAIISLLVLSTSICCIATGAIGYSNHRIDLIGMILLMSVGLITIGIFVMIDIQLIEVYVSEYKESVKRIESEKIDVQLEESPKKKRGRPRKKPIDGTKE